MAQRTKVGHYDIIAELGRGGMGVVYKGYEASLHRHVAIKMLSESLADDTSVVERFFREARSMAQLNDPHIVQIYLVGEDQGQPFFAMEFVEGESLSQRLKRDRQLDPVEASRILLQVAQGLAAAHDRGVIHRDIKPANLLITQRGLIKVADFGIALATQDFNKKLTGTGQFVGTPGYLSPEVCLGKPVDQRSDLFALGIVYFEMLTGQSPYKDESPLGMMLEVVQAGIPDVREINHAIDPRLSQILQRMVAKDPDDRYSDCHQLISDLIAAGVLAHGPITPPRPIAAPVIGTVVNTPTPPELRRPSSIQPTPAPAVGYTTNPSAAMPVAASPMVSAPRVAVVETRKSSALPWAIAVVLLLSAGGAGAWYLGAFKIGLSSPQPVLAASNTSAPSVVPVADMTPAAVTSPAAAPKDPQIASGAASAATSDSAAVLAAPSVSGNVDNQTATTAVSAQGSANPESPMVQAAVPADTLAPAQTPLLEAAPGPALLAEKAFVQASAPSDRASAPELEQSPQSQAIGARLADLRDQRLARREQVPDRASGGNYARANSLPPAQAPAPAYTGTPRVIVIGIGDDAVASPAEMAIEDSLSERGLDIVDEDLVPALARFENGGEPTVAALVAAAARHAEYVVVVRAIPVGESQLSFYGESMTQYTARLQVAAYDVRRTRKVGNGWNTQVSFTHLNADPNTREALEPLLARIADNVGAPRRG